MHFDAKWCILMQNVCKNLHAIPVGDKDYGNS